ncbi:conserved Plasmodium protein, unknown function [Plasmodium knowlesi strain H]|uniref:Uncharacterized protein n=3 Tax=Plasmodium knowlesi TaxID=5850 RepID=A0A5K1UNV3_PLAKH|nr:conserved Plasmodium protein, unknown function [Plasmodium knowlesi strain H]OTN65481.1 Uncharacterized protein PKNOH_S110080800 [Plasmodium knowlesi]CAA9989429.1 conserved Plasmodium protein, unknown function [Plasmodium knowlesi strain H]SBO25048.1 conserved Plasmodium protein, unknown function [Plasmodium knowlesi strain H]SBO27844.1 conserved Plasmodium protein, unknown function [Plasmodium knowlesi strain H]VVS78903.1 conserved Plasmodium protein, unknown function [Plasmodium knowlesi |eukprot:XP_002260156.1 hypothetical protein, conserved in Plasmodium species [Plasmodium knowlesi strain H]
MKGRIPVLTHNALLRVTNFCCARERRCPFGFFEKERSITTNISSNKEVKIKHVGEAKLKSLKKNKTVGKDDTNEDVYILNGKILYAQKSKKEKNDLKIKYGLKRAKYLDTTRNLFYSKLSDSLGESNSMELPTQEVTFRDLEGVAAKFASDHRGSVTQGECYDPCTAMNNGEKVADIQTTVAETIGATSIRGDITNGVLHAGETISSDSPVDMRNGEPERSSNLQNGKDTHFSAPPNGEHESKILTSDNVKQPSVEEEEKHKNKDTNEACSESSHYASTPKHNNDKETFAGNTSKGGMNTPPEGVGSQSGESQTVSPPNDKPPKRDIYEILQEISHEPSRHEMKAFLNSLLMHKNKKCTSFLGNYISLYFCNILSEDLKDLKNSYFDGVSLCVNSFFSMLKELDEEQLSKMTNIYLKDYFLKIFQILKSHNLSLHFENLKIENMRLLYIYNILGLTRKEGKRTKKENIKKFLYQYICVQNEDLAVMRNSNKMKFLSNIIKNGVTTRMHMLVILSYDLCAYDTTSSNCLSKTQFKNVHLEVILENQLENPFFSLQSPDSIDLKSSGWSLVDVNQILNGNLPYE